MYHVIRYHERRGYGGDATPSEVAWDNRYHTVPTTGGMNPKNDKYYQKYKKMRTQ